jgi:dynein heavy chain
VRPEVEKRGLLATKESCWGYYVQKCRNNLHVVLAMSPVGEALRTRCRNFPGMVNNTVIDWFEPWPEQVGGWAQGTGTWSVYDTTVC